MILEKILLCNKGDELDPLCEFIKKNQHKSSIKIIFIEDVILSYLDKKSYMNIDYKNSSLINRASLLHLDKIKHGFEVEKNNLTQSVIIVNDFIELFQYSTSRPGLYSLNGHVLPLNMQWQLINLNINELKTPNFHYTFGMENVETQNELRAQGYLKKNPQHIYDWDKSNEVSDEWHPFYLKIPKGEPVLCSFIGALISCLKLNGDELGNIDLISKLTAIVLQVKTLFHCYAGEILFFIDRDDIIFGAISHNHYSSCKFTHYDEMLNKWLMSSIGESIPNS